MLISNIPSVATYEYTGVRTLPIPFSFYGLSTILVGYRPSTDPTDLSPYVPLIPGTDYEVTGIKGSENDGDQAFKNGSVTITDTGAAKLTLGFTIVVTRDTPIEQQFAYNELDNFPAKSHENGLSRLAVIAQELHDNLKRALLVPPGSEGSGEEVMEEIFDIAHKAEDSAVRAEEAQQGAEEARDVAIGAAAEVNPDNFVAIDNKSWAFDAIALPEYSDADRLLYPRVNVTGDALELVDIADVVTVSSVQSRNTVIQGRMKDGYPAYLVGPEFISMQHEGAVYNSRRGTVSASGEYSTSYRATGPLRNQIVRVNDGWLTPNGVIKGWWQYDFADGPHTLVGMYYQNRPLDAGCSMGNWKLLGWSEKTSSWETIYERLKDQKLVGITDSSKEQGRMYWFTDNTKAYSRIRIQIDGNSGAPNYTSILALRFYEAVVPQMHKYDVALYASPEQPFLATVAGGLANDHTSKTQDYEVRIEEPVIFDGSLFEEMSRNYMYLVAATPAGTLPENLSMDKAVKIPGNDMYLYTDTRRIHYGTEHDIASECYGLLQSRYTTAYSNLNQYFEHNQGFFEYPLYHYRDNIHLTEKPRGAPSSYHFPGNVTAYIAPNRDQVTDGFPVKNGHPYNQECTMEVDFKWAGPAPESADTYGVIFDSGWYTSRGWVVAYYNRQRAIAIYDSSNRWLFSVPFDAGDGKWHTLSVSMRPGATYIHVDGKCLGAFDGTLSFRYPGYMYWMLGRWIHVDSHPWYGYLNNFRLTHGTCMYQGNDYEVTPVFHRDYIPHKTLWYDAAEGIVKEWYADSKTWVRTPMLPIGHVDTGRKEHLMTDQPRGTYHLQQTKFVDEYSASAELDSNRSAICLLNSGGGGAQPYMTPATAGTADHWVQFTLETSMAFERLMLCNTTEDWRAFPAIFKLLGSADGTTWETLIDRSIFVPDGFDVQAHVQPFGNTSNLGFYKSFSYDNEQAFKYYKIELPAKGDVPLFGAYGYTAVRALFTFRGAKPEVLNVNSYVIGNVFTYGPVFVTVNNEIEIPVPFENIAYDAVGFIEVRNGAQVKRRVLGQSGYNYSEGDRLSGEIVYHKRDAIIVASATSYLTPYFGRWDVLSDVENTTSSQGNIYIVAKKRY